MHAVYQIYKNISNQPYIIVLCLDTQWSVTINTLLQEKLKVKDAEEEHLDRIEEEREVKKKHKVQFYKAKFDTRITNKYEIKALIGRGSFSRVVRVIKR